MLSKIIFPDKVLATALLWQKSQGIESISEAIKIFPSKTSSINALFRGSSLSGMYQSTDSGMNFQVSLPLTNTLDYNSLGVSFNNSNKIWTGSYGQGIWHSIDGGLTWNHAGPNYVRAIAVDPVNDAIVYAGTGTNNLDGGIFKSEDGGLTWTKIGTSTYGNQNCLAIVVDLSNHSRILAGSDTGLFISSDGGLNWINVFSGNTNNMAMVIDRNDPSIFYTQILNQGIYKSLDSGSTWTSKNGEMGNPIVAKLVQDELGNLYASRSNPGGVWRSTDGAEHWENVGDPAWGTANTWGLDARGGRVYVSVEGLGLFVSDASSSPPPPPPPSPPPPPGPSPVVVIPGFGGSFSTKEFVLHQNSTDYHDWVIMPVKAPEIYNPFLNAAQTSFYLQDHKVFFFAYDFTKSVSKTAYWLNDYLQNEVLNHNPQGTKVNIVAHSMGGLVARYCFELVAGCRDKINQIVSAGTPHKGAVDDYFLWEGADFKNLDTMTTYGAKFLLHFYGLPKWNEVKLIQEKIAGARDFMPVFDYIINKPYESLSVVAKNPLLKSQLPLSDGFGQKTLALSGNRTNSTSEKMSVNPASKKETDAGYWIDGKPKTTTLGTGDGTVLTSSSNVPGAINKEFNVSHESYLNADGPFGEILKFLGLSPIGPLSSTVTTSSMIIYGDSQLLDISANGQKGEKLTKPSANVIFVVNPSKPIKRDVDVSSPIGGNFIVNGWYTDDSDYNLTSRPIKFSLFPGEKKKLNLQFK